MTDNYGADHGNNPDHENEIAGEAESWQADQPPVDDFADHAAEETATVSEETEMPAETAIEDTGRRKTSAFLPVIAAIGGLLVVGAILYWQFGSSLNNEAPSMMAQTPPPLRPVPAETAPSAPAADTGDIANLKPANDVAPTTGLAPIADATTSSSSTSPGGVATPNAAPSAPAPMAAPEPAPVAVASIPAQVPASPAPVAVMPSAPAVSAMPVIEPAPAPVPVAAPVSAAPINKSGSVDARLNDLSNHVEGLQKSLTQATQQLSAVANMIAANPPNATDERLNRIEQQLAQLQHHGASANATPEAAPVAAVSDETPRSVTHAKTRSAHKAKTVAARATHKKTASRSTSSHTAGVALSRSHWVLRAATPTEAWVAPDATGSDLRRIQIGDELPGVGRVRAIHENGGDWIVEGTQGLIQ